ncbi:MAG TPA: hypothetical protein DHW02_21845, partial [Ktedonobacter sp.]|nr:hypothetical protein [Ktedonobacter sp.]
PRFWQGLTTQSREEGEIQVILMWEQGYDYTEVRTFGFLLDFWSAGVKECFIEIVSKRAMTRRLEEMRSKIADLSPTSCTLAEGKRLIEDALSVNTWRHVEPAVEFRNNRNLINQFILDAPNFGEDSGRTFVHPELEDQETLINFLGAWSMGDFGLAYDLLSPDSNIRNGLDRNEWIERHRAWFDEAKPARVELGFVHEREQAKSALWVPNPSVNKTSRKDVELGWSLELIDTQLAGTLREFPMASAINKETGRHWFWTSYTMVRQREGWRIQSIADEDVRLQGLPINELQRLIKEYEDAMDALIQRVQGGTQNDQTAFLEEASWRFTQMLHFYDALIAKLPLDRQIAEDAYGRSVLIGNPERSMVYLERLVQRFPDNRADLQRRLSATTAALAYNFINNGMAERGEALLARAEAVLRESLTIQDAATGHMLLGELLLSQDRLDEAEQELLRASELNPTPDEQASIEAGLGNIEMHRERMDAAIPHYRRVTELKPDYAGVWFSLGFAHRLLGDLDAAELDYQHAIQQDPNDIRPYSELTAIYMNKEEVEQARATIAQGTHANPDSAHLHALYASVLDVVGDKRAARRELAEAEAIDPNLEIVRSVHLQIYEPNSPNAPKRH